jgi:hypothetical protein
MKSKCKNESKIVGITIINADDCVFENGKLRVKRKYGKFQRPIIKADMNNLKQYAEDEKRL